MPAGQAGRREPPPKASLVSHGATPDAIANGVPPLREAGRPTVPPPPPFPRPHVVEIPFFSSSLGSLSLSLFLRFCS